jgi:hypothetical protein
MYAPPEEASNGALSHRSGTYGDSRGDSSGGPGVAQQEMILDVFCPLTH